MATKDISFSLEGRTLTGSLGSRISKRDLYGYPKKVVEKEGKPLTRGYLTAVGQVINRAEISSVRLDPAGSPVEEPIVELNGEPLDLQPSAFDQDNIIEPAELTQLIGFNVQDVYPLEGLTLDPGLYSLYFSYRKSYLKKEAYLLITPQKEAFLLTGTQKVTTFVGLIVAYNFFDSEDEDDTDDDDELDFSMV